MSFLDFTKMVGTGNDFVMVDNRDKIFPVQNIDYIQRLCDRRKGVGSDGVILIENSDLSSFKMRIINPDGSEVDMCGNGARCAVYFARTLGIVNDTCTVETLAGELKASLAGDNIELNMGKPKDWREPEVLSLSSGDYKVYFVNTGVPHAVILVDDVESIDVNKLGREIRYHEKFSPDGTNCNFVESIDKHNIKVRTYERGVEAETFSCGTGTCAASLVSVLYKDHAFPLTSHTPLGEQLSVQGKGKEDEFFLAGPVEITFQGRVNL